MLQRVGIAQALVNDPDVVFLDEPMSGLDPLGRRDIRQLILRLRDRGCTVFFSSHVLSDAEALCSRVAILARGRLVASGLLSDLLAFQVRGWELVVHNVTAAAVEAATRRGDVVQAIQLGADATR
jgi:ABC-2 type transport system ATP-binding protein